MELARDRIARDIQERQVAVQKDKVLQEQLAKLRSDCEGQKSILNFVSANHKAIQDDIKRTQATIGKDNQHIKQLLGTPVQELYNEGGQ